MKAATLVAVCIVAACVGWLFGIGAGIFGTAQSFGDVVSAVMHTRAFAVVVVGCLAIGFIWKGISKL